MKYISVPKVDVNEGFRSGSVSKCALICFPDVFFLILKSRMHAITSDTQKFNGQEVFEKAAQHLELRAMGEQGAPFAFEREWEPELLGFVACAACHELTARAYLRVVGEKQVCIPCSGYER